MTYEGEGVGYGADRGRTRQLEGKEEVYHNHLSPMFSSMQSAIVSP
jgi:hypothetical protein